MIPLTTAAAAVVRGIMNVEPFHRRGRLAGTEPLPQASTCMDGLFGGHAVTSGHDELVALLSILTKREIIGARARNVGAMTAYWACSTSLILRRGPIGYPRCAERGA